ncbi:spondin-1 [Bombyx mori]|uniref:Spondin-1 n=1 Tax=Bombyx mori TaxID=7091 RepID=A0A8R1WI27_BOMMO|nr:spondin-1 [Bombyx mori]
MHETEALRFLLVLVVSFENAIFVAGESLAKCEQAPAHAQPTDDHFSLRISGEPDLFIPGELYTVTLRGANSGQGPYPFTGFKIWAEVASDFSKDETEQGDLRATADPHQPLGVFQAYDAQTKLHESCAPAVDNATAHPKTEVQVIWNAPLSVRGVCVRLSARVGPTLTANKWSVLARKICPTSAGPSSLNRQPPIVEPCCACDEAKYEVNFEGMWSRNTHPREFPPENAHAHFGDIIGASHTAQYRVWQEGRVATTGLRRLADDGSTTALEKELKAESDHIRTIIKARGISWQQVTGTGIPSTFAVFRVDAKHHLVSLAAKLAPSPDWIVGVSALELCNVNCTWRTSASLSLYPYDAGTDNGISYTSRRMPTIPAAPVRALRTDWPRDVRSPFFSTTGEMRPFARVRLTRLRLYEKSCDVTEPGTDQNVQEGVGAGGWCATHGWGPWGPCSVTCGAGRASRQRDYVWPARAHAEACRVQLTDYKHCHGPRMHCRAVSEYEPDPAESSGPCAMSPWSEWSPCDGCGVRARTRHYLAPRAYKRCHIGFRARTILSQAMPCAEGPCEQPPPRYANMSSFDWFFVDNPRGECRVTSWSDWSPCSARCGRGRRLRTRVYVVRETRVQQLMSKRLLAQWNQRFAELQNLEVATENVTSEDPEIENLVEEHLERCQFTLTQQEAFCDGEDRSCINFNDSSKICKLPMSVGHCRRYQERWFFDWPRKSCEPFGYSGCGGNDNNFRDRDECLSVCHKNTSVGKKSESVSETRIKKMKATPSSDDNEVMLNDKPTVRDSMKCATGPWLGWSNCVGDCNYAVRLNYRLVLSKDSGLGTSCRRLVKSRSCRPVQCRNAILAPTTDSTIDKDNTLRTMFNL